MGQVIAGKVKRWDGAKGFGFLIPDGGGPDVFVHARELTDGEMLVDGAPVTFICEQDAQKGPGRFRAKNCTGVVQLVTQTVSKQVLLLTVLL
jgi:cold shock CspA family protein